MQRNEARKVGAGCNSLPFFFAEIRKKDGQDYEPESFAVMQCSLDRHLKNCGRNYSILRDREFANSRQQLEAKARELRKGKKCFSCFKGSRRTFPLEFRSGLPFFLIINFSSHSILQVFYCYKPHFILCHTGYFENNKYLKTALLSLYTFIICSILFFSHYIMVVLCDYSILFCRIFWK